MEKRECGDGKNDENFFLFRSSALSVHIPSCCWIPSKGECGDGEAKETSSFTHTPLSRTSSPRGSVAKEKCESHRQVSVARAMRNERRMTRVRR